MILQGLVRTWHPRSPPRQRYLDPKDEPAEITVERNHISSGPGYSSEHRIVELHRSPNERRDTDHPRVSRSTNPERREMALAHKGIPRSQPHYPCPSDLSRLPQRIFIRQ